MSSWHPVLCVITVYRCSWYWSSPALTASLQYLLNTEEVKIKTALWMAENSDYLKEQKGTFLACNMISVLVEFHFYLSSLSVSKCTFQYFISQTDKVKPPAEPSVLLCLAFGCWSFISLTLSLHVLTVSFFLLSEKEAKIAKEKELGIYKEKKVTVVF